jgi:hypothetical protein
MNFTNTDFVQKIDFWEIVELIESIMCCQAMEQMDDVQACDQLVSDQIYFIQDTISQNITK